MLILNSIETKNAYLFFVSISSARGVSPANRKLQRGMGVRDCWRFNSSEKQDKREETHGNQTNKIVVHVSRISKRRGACRHDF